VIAQAESRTALVRRARRINRELADIMQAKGYASLADFRGKLKTI